MGFLNNLYYNTLSVHGCPCMRITLPGCSCFITVVTIFCGSFLSGFFQSRSPSDQVIKRSRLVLLSFSHNLWSRRKADEKIAEFVRLLARFHSVFYRFPGQF